MQDLPEILNWRRISADITLSGQPTEKQLADIKALGVRHIINLGPHTNKGALPDEGGSVADLGMTYIYIPVDFENPTAEDFTRFCEALEVTKEQKVHVHCIYNARVTAFFYRYAQVGKGGDLLVAAAMMDGIWRPGGVWAAFIGNKADEDKPNRYAGYDY
jgi:protein tyrosine phosphatase (PTP) superfamily phosphohydrolase (DUF442 family)